MRNIAAFDPNIWVHALLATWQQRLQRLLDQGGGKLIRGGLKGLEKESLRVTEDGEVAQTPHPRAFGSALTHSSITTDYSEALLELITAPRADIGDTVKELTELHAYVYRNLPEGELLWATSMPCIIGGDASIPIAQYGSSNIGTMRHVYRRGLDYRYGRSMQAIAGVHFNYSLPTGFWPLLAEIEADRRSAREVQSSGYFRLIRNFQRWSWLVPYLFGASPAICRTFLGGRQLDFDALDRGTLYLPYATSLRMSDIGYQNKAQDGLEISYDDLPAYVRSLTRAINTIDPGYAAIGARANGEWRQLNASVLQIEAEYYSFIRPKPIIESGEKPTVALSRRGVEYVEMRALDVNAFEPTGVHSDTLRFLELLLIACMLEDSSLVDRDEQREIDHNQALVTRRGREPGLVLRRDGRDVPLRAWGEAIAEAAEAIAEVLDGDHPEQPYRRAVKVQQAALADPELTPSARILASLRAEEEPFVRLAMQLSHDHAEHFLALPLPPEREAALRKEAADSLRRQAEIEAEDRISFEEFLEHYFAQQPELS